jgi:hypothetical protein
MQWQTHLISQSTWHPLGQGLIGEVNDIFIDGDNIYVAGNFLDAGGNPDIDYLALWNGENWEPVGPKLSGPVRVVRVYQNQVYVGGQFSNAGGNPDADGVARLGATNWEAIHGGINDVVNAIEFHQDALYVGGRFTDAGGNPDADYITRLDSSGWQALGAGLVTNNFGVWTLASSGQDLYVGGDISVVGMDSTRSIVRWDGTKWNALGPGFGGDMGVIAIAINGNDVYAGGDGGPLGLFMCGIARWDGTAWNRLDNGLSNCLYGEGAYEILAYEEGCFVGGVYNHTGIDHSGKIAYWNGVDWQSLGNPGLDDGFGVYAIAAHGDQIYIGGSFHMAGGVQGANNIARWDGLTVSADDPQKENLFTMDLYPNPSRDFVHVNSAWPFHIRIATITGQLVLENEKSYSHIDISMLPEGIYVMEIIAEGQTTTRPLIKL